MIKAGGEEVAAVMDGQGIEGLEKEAKANCVLWSVGPQLHSIVLPTDHESRKV